MRIQWKPAAKALALTSVLFAVAVALAYLKERSPYVCLALVFLMILGAAYVVFREGSL